MPTHDDSGVRRIGEKCNIPRFRDSINSPKLHIQPTSKFNYTNLGTCKYTYLSVMFAKYCCLARKHFDDFMHCVTTPVYRQHSVCFKRSKKQKITETSPKLNAKHARQIPVIDNKISVMNLLFHCGIDIVSALWENDHNNCRKRT